MLLAAVDELLSALLPARCPGCGRRGAPLCAGCEAELAPAPGAPPPPLVAWWTACFAYAGVGREVVARAKYRGERVTLRLLSARVAAAARGAPGAVDVLTWAPASDRRYARAGVDHAEVLARAVARELGVPVRRLLHRAPGPPQTGRDAASRRSGPRLRAMQRLSGLTVLVVDDVATTGGTLTAAARALRAGGARTVFAATIARTPAPGGPPRDDAYTRGLTR